MLDIGVVLPCTEQSAPVTVGDVTAPFCKTEKVVGAGADGANAGFIKTRGDNDLVGEEQPLDPFVVFNLAAFFALVGVAPQLVDGFGDGLVGVGRFAFDDADGDAVHKQHDVGGDEFFGVARWAIDAELADGEKRIVLGVLPVHELNRLLAALVPAGQAIDHDAAQQQLRAQLVRFDELGRCDAQQFAHGVCGAVVVEPGFAVAEVDFLERAFEIALEDDFFEAGAPGDRRLIEVAGWPWSEFVDGV
jgi:hypothetical protein